MGGALVPGDPFYKTGTWARLKAVVRRRSGGVCEVLECSAPAVVCDHIVARRAGGADHESNLRDLCRQHDGQVKEMADGSRRRDGRCTIRGCDADGWPLDPARR